MKPVYQTLFSPPNGNCLQACIASIFELPLDEVPNFVVYEDWRGAYDDWLASRGVQAITLDPQWLSEDTWLPKGYHLVCGKSPRGDWRHALVGYQMEVVHDPYELGDGTLEEIDEIEVFVLLDPSLT